MHSMASNLCVDPSVHFAYQHRNCLFVNIVLWGNSADDRLMIFFLFFPRKQDLTFHANCLGDSLHEMSDPIF